MAITEDCSASSYAHCLVLQVHSISKDAFFGVSSNSNGANGLTYYLYPPPVYNSVEAEGEPQTGCTFRASSCPAHFAIKIAKVQL